jgi:hypothetical protein
MNGSIAYIQRSIDAVARLALRDTQALSLLDMTVDGFYRSFAAMIVAAPLYAAAISGWRHMVISFATTAGHKFQPGELEFGAQDFVLDVARYVLLWLAFPIVALAALRFLGQTARYSALIIAYNWSAVIVLLLFNVPLALFGLGISAPFPTVAMMFTVFGFALYYRFFLAVAALQAGSGTAMAIAVINALLFFYIVLGIDFLSIWLSR